MTTEKADGVLRWLLDHKKTVIGALNGNVYDRACLQDHLRHLLDETPAGTVPDQSKGESHG